VKNYSRGKSRRKDFGLAEKGGAFFRQRELQKMYGKEAAKKKEERKGLIAKLICQ
jgi:hypothetical protein